MAGLTDKAAGFSPPGSETIANAHKSWEKSMLRRLESLRGDLRARSPVQVANFAGAEHDQGVIRLDFWGREVAISWPELSCSEVESGQPCSTFDSAILLYYLWKADGTAPSGKWIGFRELPDGTFYHQAFQGYSGGRIARHFGDNPARFEQSALNLSGAKETGLAENAYSFLPLPRTPIAVILWPGDEDFPTKASVLFEEMDSHYLPTDGLALLGSGLAGRLIKADSNS